MQAAYEQVGVTFQYPDNWALDDSGLETSGAVAVYSPGGAFWSLAVHPPEADPEQLAKEAMETLRKEYPDSDAEPTTEIVADHDLAGYDLNFFYLDLTNTALVRSLRTANGTYLILCQAEDREFDRLRDVFRAITTSLLWEQPDAME